MKTICLYFGDILELLEFIDLAKLEDCAVDVNRQTLTGTLTDAQLELALHGFSATLIDNQRP